MVRIKKDTPAIETIRAIIETEKEVASKSGMMKVVKWVNRNFSTDQKEDGSKLLFISDKAWQQFLKDNELNEE